MVSLYFIILIPIPISIVLLVCHVRVYIQAVYTGSVYVCICIFCTLKMPNSWEFRFVVVLFQLLLVRCLFLSFEWRSSRLMAFPLLLKCSAASVQRKNLFRVNAPPHKTSFMSVWVKLFHFWKNIDEKLQIHAARAKGRERDRRKSYSLFLLIKMFE